MLFDSAVAREIAKEGRNAATVVVAAILAHLLFSFS
jgi:hypothetical protein